MEFTEDGILNMMLEIFRNLHKFYKDGNVPRYFIPKLNLLEEYSKEVKRVKLQQFLKTAIYLRNASFYNLWYLYNEKIHKNKGFRNNKDKLEFLHELYVTFLFKLMERTLRCDHSNEENRDDLLIVLYYLMVYGYNCLQNDIASLGDYKFIAKYNTYINDFLSVHFTFYECKLICNALMPNICFLDEKTKLKTQSFLCQHYKEEELPEKWINGDFDNMSFVHEMHRFGNKEYSKNLHEQFMSHDLFRFDFVFKSLVSSLNSYFSNSYKSRCLKEIEKIRQPHEQCSWSYFLRYLVQDMFEMYSYGFTDGKFHLPTPAVYMSYL